MAGSAMLAAGYFVMAWLSFALAVPPGYASPIWPAAGLALAALLLRGPALWPGIWIGSFLVNVVNTWPAPEALSATLLVSAGIAVGATLQALLGAAVVRRLAPGYRVLERDRDIFRFLLLGGPLTCLLSASVGVCVLVLGGVIDAASVPRNWLTWWAGDSLGTVIAAPLCMLLATAARSGWRFRRVVVVLPVSVVAAMVIAFSLRASQLEVERLNARFARHAEGVAQAITERLETDVWVLDALDTLFASTDAVERGEFERFASRLLPRHGGAESLAWIQVLGQQGRQQLERDAGDTISGGLQVTERAADGRLVSAGERSHYAVVRHASPPGRGASTVGFDLYSSPMLAGALERAVDAGVAVATPLLRSAQGAGGAARVAVYLPVFADGERPASVIERRARLVGFVAAEYRVGDLVAAARETANAGDVSVRIEDRTALSGITVLHDDGATRVDAASYPLTWHRSVDLAGREWHLRVTAGADFLDAYAEWQAGLVMLGGLVVTGLLEGLLLLFSARAGAVTRLVAKRTRELTAANRRLELEVAERARVEASLVSAKQAAETASCAKSEFLANVSHEIRTPLNAILGLTELSLAARVDEGQRENLELVRDAGRSLLDVINEVLDFSRIESGRLTLEQIGFDARELVHGVCRLLRAGAEAKGLVLDAHVGAEVPALLVGDPTALRQVVVNLVGNAIKFTERGSIIVTLRQLSREETAAELELEVRDTGIGVPAARREAIFDAFCQADNSTTRSHGGSGLGLTICARLIEAMGGGIRLQSHSGAGSVFVCRLTLGIGEASAPVAAAPRQPTLTPGTVALRVLLAEDNVVNQKVASRLLQKLGHDVVVANNGREALAAVQAGVFDVVLMDLQMPEMDGMEALRAIRSWQAERDVRTPVVALTAHAMSEDRRRCLAAGMDGYLAKPFDFGEFAAMLHSLGRTSVA